jgi:DNA-binding PadR family transcriptional regulator
MKQMHFGLWELAVLALLRERSMHPYEMQRLLRERRKDELLVLKRGSLYHAIQRLARAELIQSVKTGRNGRRPERTTYRVSSQGRAELIRQLRGIVAVPQRESSEFMAGMSFVIHLDPRDALGQLVQREERLVKQIDELRKSMESALARVTRINLLESEYLLAMQKAELQWIRGVVKQLRDGTLKWDFSRVIAAVRAARKSAAGRAKP